MKVHDVMGLMALHNIVTFFPSSIATKNGVAVVKLTLVLAFLAASALIRAGIRENDS
jgi:hypothetical protein